MGKVIGGFFTNILRYSKAHLKAMLIHLFAFLKEKKIDKIHIRSTTIPKLIPIIKAYPDNNKFLTCKVLFMKEKFTSTIERAKLFSITLTILIASMFFANNAIGQIAFRNAQSTTTSTTTLTINKPTNLAVGDLMIANILQDGNDASNFVDAVGNGATWTLIAGTNLLTSGNDRWRSTILYKVATADDVAANTFSFDLDAQSDDGAGGILAFSGVAVTGGVSSTPFDVTPGSALTNIANDNSLTATAVNTVTSNAMIVMLGAAANDVTFSNWVASNPATLTEAIEQLLNVALDASVGAAYGTRTGTGSTNTASATISGTITNGALLVALRPCTANPTITTASTPQATAAVCFSGSPQSTTLAYTATTNSPNAYSIDWNAAANTAGLTDQNSTAFAFAGGGGTVTGITIPASVAAGTYNGTMYITTAAGCITSKTITLTINAPTVNAGGAVAAICQGGTSAALGGSFGGSATAAVWTDGGAGGSFANNGGATPNTATYTASPTSSSPVTLTLTTSGGSCGTTFATKNIVVNATPPTPNAGPDQTICFGATTLAANAAAPGTGAWTILAGSPNTSTTQLSSTSNAAATFTPTLSGTYTLRWSITNGACTTTPDDVIITVNPLPQVSVFTGNTICFGGIGQLTVTTSAGTAPFTVTYNPGAVSEPDVNLSAPSTPFNATPNPGSTTNYTIATITDANGCTRSSGFTDAAASIAVFTPLTSLSYSTNPAVYCPGVTIAANNPTAVGGIVTTYSISPALPSGLSLNTSTGVITGAPTASVAATDYTVTATNTCGSVQATVNIKTAVSALTTTPGARCGTGSVSLSATSNTSCFTPTINWYAAATGGSSLGTGAGFNTPSIPVTTPYFAEESFTTAQTTIGTGNSTTTNRGLAFTLFEPIVLRTVQVQSNSGTANLTFALQDNTGAAVPGVSNVTTSVTTGVNTITLNWTIPAGSYRILYSSGTSALRRTDSYTFPTTIGVGVITSSIEAGSVNSSRYNFFYNWVIARARVSATATVNANPTVALNAIPSIDRGTVSANLSYSGTTGSPNEYSIDYDAAAEGAGFFDITNDVLPATPIVLTVPGAADAITYSGNLTVRNNSNGCVSSNNAISITINKTELIVTADNKNKTFDGNPFTGFTSDITGFINGENSGVVSGSVTYTGAATTATAIGSYTITPVVSGLSATNYFFTAADGTLTIDAITEANADFRSKANGNFSDIGTWEYDLGGNNWQDATQAPGINNNVLITHNVILNQNYTVGGSRTFDLGTGAILTVNPTRTLTIAGSADFTGKSVTFKSDNTGYGSLGEVTGSLNGASNVTVERYIPDNGFRSWRLLAVPTTGSQTINAAWQEGQAPLVVGTSGLGTLITGPGGANGLDAASAQSSMLRWNTSTNNWTGITATTGPLSDFDAYFLYIRGDRSKGLSALNGNSNATTLRSRGTLYVGDQTTSVPTSQFRAVANRYASAIDFTGLTRNNVSNTFYIWDSKKINGNSLGIYQTFSGTTLPAFKCMISGGSYTLNQPNTVIESGQSFLVQGGATLGGGSITLVESAKTNGVGSLGFRPSSQPFVIDSRLYTNSNDMVDANTVVMDGIYSNDVDGDDAIKLSNPGENFAILKSNNTVLAVEGRQPVANNDVIQFKLWNLHQQTYRAEFVASNMNEPGLTAFLEDAYLNSSTALDLTGTTNINFTVDANAASSDANRFKIVFRQLAPVPVSFISISGNRTNAGVKVTWKVAAERNIKQYEIERSADGSNFSNAGTAVANSSNTTEATYNFTDAAAPSSAVFYRVKSVDINGMIKYSEVVKIAAGIVKPGFTVSPNPVENGIMNLQFKNQQAGEYTIRIISNNGESVMVSKLQHTGGNSTQSVSLPESIARGTYNVEITAPNKTKTVQALLVNTK